MKAFVMALVVLGSVSAMAQSSAPAAAATGKAVHPCEQIKTACEGAGFVKGEHKQKKGLIKDCMQPILAGQSVAGVTIGSDVVAACKEKKAEKAKK